MTFNNLGGLPAPTRMGPPNSMTSQHRQCRNVDGSFSRCVLPIPPPYSIRPCHIHGATCYGGHQLGALNVLVVRFAVLWGDFGGGNLDRADVPDGNDSMSAAVAPWWATDRKHLTLCHTHAPLEYHN